MKNLVLSLALLIMMAGCAAKLSDQAADTAFVEATTHEERALRLCMGAAIVSEVWLYRLEEEGATREQRDRSVGAMSRMSVAASSMIANTDNVWFETEMFYAVKTLISAAGQGARDRLLNRLSNFVSEGYTPLVFLQGLKTLAGQAGLTQVMMSDVRRLYDGDKFGTLEGQEEAWNACLSRMEQTIKRL
ncbi:MAG: hypothetical protein ACXABY_26030 [Candidatus Thorarchaeota archaeon]|jgi:hypothetical protein